MILLALPLVMSAQVEFIEVVTSEDYQEAIDLASDRMQILFVDVYATWCGPCKMMDRDVYTDPAVAEYMNKEFVNVRMDGETPFGRQFASLHALQGYPSMFLIDHNAEVVGTIVGFKPAEELLKSLKLTLDAYKGIKKYEARFLAGELEPGELVVYLDALRGIGQREKAEAAAETYALKLGDRELTETDIRILSGITDMGDPWWEDYASDFSRLERIFGDTYATALSLVYQNTLVKAVEEGDITLISALANELAPILIELNGAKYQKSLPFVHYYYLSRQYDELIAYVDERFASDRKDDHIWLFAMASNVGDMDQESMNSQLLEKEIDWFTACIALKEESDYYFYRGVTHLFIGDVYLAMTDLEQALELAENDEEKVAVQKVIDYVNSVN